MTKPACKSFQGCRGEGWNYDLSDSGSGRTCYCDCAAGVELRLRETCPTLRTLRLRKRADRLPPWYYGRDIGKLAFLPLDPLPAAWPPCECCGKSTSMVRTYSNLVTRSVCHECTTMLRFAGLDLYATSTTGSETLPADWHRAALPSQREEGEAYAAALRST